MARSLTGWLAGWRTKARAHAPSPGSPIPDWLQGVGAPSEPPRGYEAQVRSAYLGNPVAQRAVRLVADAVAGAPLVVPAGDDEGPLALISRTLREAVASALLLHGNAWVDVVEDDAGRPVGLHMLRPERVSAELGADNWPVAWVYRVGSRTARYPVEGPGALVHLKTYHPLDDHYGLGALGAASGAVELLNAADKWNRALIANAARPSGALVYDTGDAQPMTGEQFARLKNEVVEGFAGAVNAGKPMLLEGGLKWQALSLTPAEMDFRGAREAAAREVGLAFGVPPLLLGLPGDSTYSDYREANVALWRLTVLPMAGLIADALGARLGASVSVDLDNVPALWADREKLWRHVGDASFLSRDEKRELLGYDAEGGTDG